MIQKVRNKDLECVNVSPTLQVSFHVRNEGSLRGRGRLYFSSGEVGCGMRLYFLGVLGVEKEREVIMLNECG